jgi:hypothetical protein
MMPAWRQQLVRRHGRNAGLADLDAGGVVREDGRLDHGAPAASATASTAVTVSPAPDTS